MNAQLCPTAGLEKLLLSTDGSEFSEGAIREAINLAKTCSSRLFAVSVVEVNPEFEALAPQLVEKVEKETRQHLESVKSRAAGEGVECEIIAHQGEEPYKYIVEEAAKNRVDMIIMGRRGRSGLKRLMLGSVAAKVIGHAPCNVLIAPRAARVVCKNILIATDGSRYSDAASMQSIGIAKRLGSSLFAVSVAHSDAELQETRDNVNRVKELAGREGIKVETLTPTGRPYEAIVDAARQMNADLIVVGSHGRTGIERLLMGSVTERVIGHADCAVLVVKA